MNEVNFVVTSNFLLNDCLLILICVIRMLMVKIGQQMYMVIEKNRIITKLLHFITECISIIAIKHLYIWSDFFLKNKQWSCYNTKHLGILKKTWRWNFIRLNIKSSIYFQERSKLFLSFFFQSKSDPFKKLLQFFYLNNCLSYLPKMKLIILPSNESQIFYSN